MKTSLTLLLTAGIAMAQPPTPTFNNVKTALGLTDAQITSLTALRTQERQTIQPLEQQIATRQTALRTLLTNGTTAAVAGQALLDVESLRKQIETAVTRFRTQAVGVLTAEQKTKLASLEAAAKLRPAIGEAGVLNLLTPDTTNAGPGFGPGGPRGLGGGPGFGGRTMGMRPPGPPPVE